MNQFQITEKEIEIIEKDKFVNLITEKIALVDYIY